MASNRAVTFMGPGKLEVRETKYPRLADPQGRKIDHAVILKLVTTNICGSDLHIYNGRFAAPAGMLMGHDPAARPDRLKRPSSLHDKWTEDRVMARTTSSGNSMVRQDFCLTDDPLMDAMSAGLARNWWVIALRGVFAILFGIIAIVLPGVAIASLVLLFAAYMLADGLLAIVAGVRAARQGERWGWLIFEGVADILASAAAFLWPLVTVLFFVCLMSAWAIVSGTMLMVAAFRLHIDHGRWLPGEPFDPNWHEAVHVVADTPAPAGTVAEVLQPGYRLHERLLRPAIVSVSGP